MSLFAVIKQQLPIVDVVGEHVPLKPAGAYWKGSCIFHAEKDASFTVSVEKQIFYCFGCHASGDVISFIAKLENLTQREAAQLLIERYHLNIPAELLQASHLPSSQEKDARDRYFFVCKAFATWMHAQLLKNTAAKSYMLDRSINQNTINLFHIGYFPGGTISMSKLIKEMQDEGILLKDLIETGIITEGRNGLYSGFEERIVFPIKDAQGRHCGFGGRVFKQGDDRAKYYNSKEADGFEKGKILFGLDAAKKRIQEENAVFLVEGYIDCVMMVQHGFANTVATLGTACTHDHLKQLARHAQTLYVLYDGDNAGQKATLRLAELCWEVNLDVKVVALSAKHDPASFLVGGGNMAEQISKATDIMEHFVAVLGKDFATKPLAQKMATAEKVATAISNLGNPFKQDLLLHHAAAVMNVPYEALKRLLKQQLWNKKSNLHIENKLPVAALPETELLPAQDESSILEEKIFSGILGGIAAGKIISVHDDIMPYASPVLQRIHAQALTWAQDHAGKPITSDFFDTLDPHDKTWAMRAAMAHSDQTCFQLFDRLLDRLCKIHWQRIVTDIKDEIVKAKQENNSEKVNAILQRFAHLKQGMIHRGPV